MTATNEFADTKREIQAWINSAGGSFADIPEPSKVWAVVATMQDLIPCVVSMEVTEPDVVSFGINIELAVFVPLFNRLTADEKRNLIYDLRIGLISADIGLGYSVPASLSPLTLGVGLYVEELTKASVIRTIYRINNAYQLIEFM
ncbi:MAG: DUF2299 family protein, partial [Pyrinomonadaceae bacterium]